MVNTSIVGISIFFSILACIAVGLRFYCRKLKKVELGLDDYFILPALFFAVALGAVNTAAAYLGHLGEHVPVGPNGELIYDNSVTLFLKFGYVGQVISVVVFAFTKLSILFFYRRIFRGAVFSYVTWFLIFVSIGWGLSITLATAAQCTPVELNWTTNYLDPTRHCVNVFTLYIATAATDFIIDLAILAIPWPNVWRLQLPTRQKFAVIGIFMLGALVCGISIARFVFFVQATQAAPGETADVTWYASPPIYWTQLEGAFAVICACLPTLRPLFQGISPESIFGTRGGRIFSVGSSKATSRKMNSSEENNSSVALRSVNSLKDGEEHPDIPSKSIRVKQDLDVSISSVHKQ